MHFLTLCHCNMRSVLKEGKIEEPGLFVSDHNIDILAIAELWLDNSICVRIHGFHTVFRNDRNRHGGGVIVYISDHVTATRVPDLEFPSMESIWVSILCSGKTIILGAYYRPPNATAEDRNEFLAKLSLSIELSYQLHPTALFLVGDFNDRCPQWNDNHEGSELGLELYNMVNSFHMEQIIETPTRITTQSANILDLIITDAPAFIQQSGVLPPVGTCDHSPVYCRINFKTTVKRAYHRTIWNYNEANLDGLYDALSSAPWHVAFATSDNGNESLEYWQNLYLQNINSFIPNKNVIIRPKDKPWVTTELKRLIHKRNASWRRFRRTQNCEHFLIYKLLRNNVVSLNRRCLLQYTSKMQSFLCGPKSNIRKFWSYSRALLGRKAIVNLPPLLHEGQSFISPMEKQKCLTHTSQSSVL